MAKSKKKDTVPLLIKDLPPLVSANIVARAGKLGITPEQLILNILEQHVEEQNIEKLFKDYLKGIGSTFTLKNLLDSCLKPGYKKVFDKLPTELRGPVIRYCLNRIQIGFGILINTYGRKT
jgi:hypothetical protein